MNKPFKTFDEQIAILKSRNLIIDDDECVKEILSQINYYNVINGYKNIFLKRDLNGNLVSPEKFKDGAEFDELYSLYSMDTELKQTIFPYILRFEKLLKTSCSYHFAKEYRESYSYLQMKNYSNEKSDLEIVLKNLSTLSSMVNTNKRGKPAIKHYVDNHNEIPIWVLINFLTLGNVSYFYNALSNTLQAKISRDFGERFTKEYSIKEKVEAGELADIIRIFNLFRNIIAHDEVMFSTKLKRAVSVSKFEKFFGDKFKGCYLSDVVILFKLVLPKVEFMELISKLDKIFESYKEKFVSVKLEDILKISGFDFKLSEI